MPTTKCPYCAEEIQLEAIKCKHCGCWLPALSEGLPTDPPNFPVPWASRHLRRSSRNRMLAGVCGGLAEYLGVDPTLVRIVYALGSFFSVAFPGIAVYIILALIIPSDDASPT